MSEVKTMLDWERFAEAEGGNFYDFCHPGDLVDQKIFDHFLNSVQPHRMEGIYLQAGEPYDTRYDPRFGRQRDRYTTFLKVSPEAYRYCGNCFDNEKFDREEIQSLTIREFLKKTYCVIKDYGLQMTRPRIFCCDGFSISVQAGSSTYSEPRENLEGGMYKCVEVGFPSAREELLMKYAEDPHDPTDSIYPYVPVALVDKVIQKHGGISSMEE